MTVSVRKRPFFIPCSVTFVNGDHAPGDSPDIENTGYFIQFIGYFDNTRAIGPRPSGVDIVTIVFGILAYTLFLYRVLGVCNRLNIDIIRK